MIDGFQPNAFQPSAFQIVAQFIRRVLVKFRMLEPDLNFKMRSPSVLFRLLLPSTKKRI